MSNKIYFCLIGFTIFIFIAYIFVGKHYIGANLKSSYPSIGLILTALFGWCITHSLNLRQNSIAKKNELVISYLIKAYGIIDNACNRTDYLSDDKNAREFETAMSDIMLFGTNEEQQLALEVMQQFDKNYKENNSSAGVDIEELLEKLRVRLREELNLEKSQMTTKRLRLIPQDPP